MSDEPGKRSPTPGREADPPPYRVYRSGRPDRSAPEKRPYTLYRSRPKGLRDRLREPDEAVDDDARRGLGPPSRGAGKRGSGGGDGGHRFHLRGKPITPWRVVRWLVALVVAWVLLSVVLFFVSAQTRTGSLPAGAKAQLSGGGPMIASANTILVLGLDNRPTSGAGSKEGGLTSADTSEKYARTDSIMLWRIGGGASRRLSIPRDTLVDIPGCGRQKINAAWSCGGPGRTIQAVKQLTGLRHINHMIVVDLGNFPKFIDDIGGVNVRTGRICSDISGGSAHGGFSLHLRPGVHHLTGLQALTLARTRDNSCDPAYTDLNREAAQQQIINSIKSQLISVHTFLHLPWAAWDAPGVIQTDMGGLSMLQLVIAAEIGGSAPPRLLKERGSTYNGADVLVPDPANVHREVRKLLNGH